VSLGALKRHGIRERTDLMVARYGAPLAVTPGGHRNLLVWARPWRASTRLPK
jgi:hypothetical protein